LKFKVNIAGEEKEFTETLLDRSIRYASPKWANKRLESNIKASVMSASSGGYFSGSGRWKSNWHPGSSDSDGDVLVDLEEMRSLSRASIRTNMIASSAVNTLVTGTVGKGSRLKSQIDREVLAMGNDEADAWENNTQREWRLFWDTYEVDAARRLSGAELEGLYFRSVLENGDTFSLMPSIPRKGVPYSMKVQLIEADRVTNIDNKQDTAVLSGGIKRSKVGAPIEYYFLKTHPGNSTAGSNEDWDTIRAYGANTGRKNVIHGYQSLRIGQNRGVPLLATVIEPLKQLDRYTDAEIMSAVVASMFTVFITTEGDQTFPGSESGSDFGQNAANTEMKLGAGAIVGLNKNESVSTATPGRPNSEYAPFITAIIQQIGAQLEIPYEVLIKKFDKSFSAAKAALLQASKLFMCRQEWMARTFLNVIYENWMMEAVSIGRITAPGFLSDPLMRQAYLGKEWVWMPVGSIEENKQVQAAVERVNAGFSTIERETIMINGGDWEKNHIQSAKEVKMRKEDDLIVDPKKALEPVSVGE